jgi:Na+-translocating ferredoxin:NAD+ oxidoreductase RnfG subunit
MCPWREPASDLKLFFPNATGYKVETRVLSGLRLELATRLGRTPTGDENALRVYSVYQNEIPLGLVLTRRVKGELGAIELVLAVNTNQQVCGMRLQRLREPEASATILQSSDWLRSFDGKSADDAWQLGQDIPNVPTDARASAESIVGGVRSSLILLAVASQVRDPMTAPHH